MRFCNNTAYDITMYSGHSQQPKRNRFQDMFWALVFLVNNIFSKNFMFLILQNLKKQTTKGSITK